MDTVARNKWQIRGAAILIFVLGFTAGMLALGLIARGPAALPRPAIASNQLANTTATESGSENQSATDLWGHSPAVAEPAQRIRTARQ